MIARIIRASIAARVWVLLAAALLAAWGVHSLRTTSLDALPDLSDTQVIIRAQFPGKAPQLVEDQVTYPLTTALLSVPGATSVRGYSFFGDSFVYVLFDDATDLYWARSRVTEYVNQVQNRLPAGVRAELGPDGTGVGWVFEYALVDRTGRHDLSQLRALNDWFVKFELRTVRDVAEVASMAAWSGNTRSSSTRTACARSACHTPGCSMRSLRPTRNPEAPSSKSRKPSTWSARTATYVLWRTSATSS